MQGIRTKLTVALMAFGMMAAGMQAASAEDLVKWREGIVPFKADAGFFYMAKEKGFFRKHGIDVEFVQIPGNVKLVRALLAGTVDAIEASPGAMLKAILHGADIQFIGSTLPGLTYAFYVRKDIKDWADLKGKVIGASSPGSVADIFSRVALRNHGVDPKTITISNAGGSSGTYIKALSQGSIAAASASTEFVPVADKLGIKPLTTVAKEAPLYPRLILTSTTKLLKAKGADVVARFMAGYMEGLHYALAHPQETINLTAKLLHKPATNPTYSFLFNEIVEEKDASPTMVIPRDRIEWLQNYMLENKLLAQKVDLDKHIDGSYRLAAFKILQNKK